MNADTINEIKKTKNKRRKGDNQKSKYQYLMDNKPNK